MIVVDTNVLSALLLPRPIPLAVSWFNAQPNAELWTTSVTVFELLRGARTAPGEAKRRALLVGIEGLLALLDGRILPLDDSGARIAADLFGERYWRGFNVPSSDTLIAGIVVAHGATLATRNVRHFADLPIEVVNPRGDGDPGAEA